MSIPDIVTLRARSTVKAWRPLPSRGGRDGSLSCLHCFMPDATGCLVHGSSVSDAAVSVQAPHVERLGMCTHIALHNPPAASRIKVLQLRARDEAKPWHVQGRTASRRLVEQGAGDPATAHGLVDPESRKPRREIGPGRLVVVDHQRVAARLPVDLRHQRNRYGAVRLQVGVETVADLGKRRSPMAARTPSRFARQRLPCAGAAGIRRPSSRDAGTSRDAPSRPCPS